VKTIFAACGVSLAVPFAWAMSTLRQLWRCEMIAASMPMMTNEELAKLVTATLDKFGADKSIARAEVVALTAARQPAAM